MQSDFEHCDLNFMLIFAYPFSQNLKGHFLNIDCHFIDGLCCIIMILQKFLLYQWLEDSLKAGEKVPEDRYVVKEDNDEEKKALRSSPALSSGSDRQNSPSDGSRRSKKTNSASSAVSGETAKSDATDEVSTSSKNYDEVSISPSLNFLRLT